MVTEVGIGEKFSTDFTKQGAYRCIQYLQYASFSLHFRPPFRLHFWENIFLPQNGAFPKQSPECINLKMLAWCFNVQQNDDKGQPLRVGGCVPVK